MKTGILYICTGKYSVFWNTFYESAEKYFLNGINKKYFIFTDSSEIISSDKIKVKYENSKGFPLDSLLRFKMFLSIEKELKEMDYIFFFNANMMFVDYVGEEVLPSKKKFGLVGTLHPGHYLKNPSTFPYERNKKSKAYIPYNDTDSYYYYMGGFNGGRAKDFLKLSKECAQNIEDDFRNDIMAIYHDESHLNSYLHGKDILRLTPSYGFPENSNLNIKPKIIILNKIKHAGRYFDKLPKRSYHRRIYLKLKRLYSTIIWKYQ